ncbi:MAG: DedA family protein [Candidatus Nomurabacteria bacterium]|jgi:membrane-associated protein|nr:DedA family protein [Candidatus Nomurabacteria bacterium]
MSGLAAAILPYILLYKYWALFIITFIASLAIPIPAGTLLVASAAFAAQGYFNIVILIVVVIIANMAGDNLAYWLARYYGRKVLYRVGFIRKILTSKDFTVIEKRIAKRPGLIIFLTRFEVIATLTTNLICGLGKVPYKKFLLYEALGALVDTVFYAMLGYLFGDTWQAIDKLIGNFTLVIFLAVALGVALSWKKLIHHLSQEAV